MNFAMFFGPLLVFTPKLYKARERALLEYGRLANRHHLAFHHKWIEGTAYDQEILGSTDFSSATDLNGVVEVVREMRIVPIDRTVVIQLAGAAGVPLLAVVAREVPLGDIFRWIVGSLP